MELIVDFTSSEGAVVFSAREPLPAFPELPYCAEGSSPFFAVLRSGLRKFYAYMSFGDLLVFPLPDTRIESVVQVQLPNSVIGQISSVRARIADGAKAMSGN